MYLLSFDNSTFTVLQQTKLKIYYVSFICSNYKRGEGDSISLSFLSPPPIGTLILFNFLFCAYLFSHGTHRINAYYLMLLCQCGCSLIFEFDVFQRQRKVCLHRKKNKKFIFTLSHTCFLILYIVHCTLYIVNCKFKQCKHVRNCM